jgi:hypothetical protein
MNRDSFSYGYSSRPLLSAGRYVGCALGKCCQPLSTSLNIFSERSGYKADIAFFRSPGDLRVQDAMWVAGLVNGVNTYLQVSVFCFF